MSFFSPVSARSPSVRGVMTLIYVLLFLGALTMVLPLLTTVTGSVTGSNDSESTALYPKLLVSDQVLWKRYLDARYGGSIENFRMAWNSSTVDFHSPDWPPPPTDPELLRLWREFLRERGSLSPTDAGLAFTRATNRHASLENRSFRQWLMRQYDDNLNALNEALGTEVQLSTWLRPPLQNRIVLTLPPTLFLEHFEHYLQTVPESHRLFWNVGGFYRSIYLPRVFGRDVAAWNEAMETTFPSYGEIPFPATVPAVGAAPWFDFVQKVLNPDFIEFTTLGRKSWKQSGLKRIEFIRRVARPEDLRVVSIDTAFAEWAATRGQVAAQIPQATLDREDFLAKKAFWRWQFVSQNFVFVLDNVMLQGNGIRNTLILVILTVAGALTINPLAAYALSRFKLRQSYQILLFFLATIAFPAEVAMIPNFLLIKEFGLLNTFGALVLPGLVSGFSIFLLKGFFDSLPRELYEAADIDGASEWQIFWGMTMNLSKPILAVIALGAFIQAYSAFFFALILAPKQEMWTLMVWIYQLQQNASPGIVFASVIITAIPTLIVYLCTQNVILRGIVVPSEK